MDSKNLKIVWITLVGIFVFYGGIQLVGELVSFVYPLLKIQMFIKSEMVHKLLDKKRGGNICIETLKESIFWLKYWSLYAVWNTLDIYISYIPIINYLKSYVKILLFGSILVRKSIESKNSDLPLYDYLEDYINYITPQTLIQYKEEIKNKIAGLYNFQNLKFLHILSTDGG